MRTKHGGETVDRGFYLSFGRNELLNLEDAQTLPGTKADKFYPIPLGVMLFLGPFIGLLYVMFLPFISLAMVAVVLSRAIWLKGRKAGRRLIPKSNRMRSHFQTAELKKETRRVEPVRSVPLITIKEGMEKSGRQQFQDHL